jgi:hypothetical protein
MNAAQHILEKALADYSPEIRERASALIAKARAKVPGANILVYDAYNALAVGFSANDKQSGIAFSITSYPRWVSLFFPRGVDLDDPCGLLEGSGKAIRHVVMENERHFDEPGIRALIDQALASCEPPVPDDGDGEIIIKAVSANKRPRRPK